MKTGSQSGDPTDRKSPHEKPDKNKGSGPDGHKKNPLSGVSGPRPVELVQAPSLEGIPSLSGTAGNIKKKHVPAATKHDAGGSPPQGAAGRSFWSGAIAIGLINIPVRLNTMVRDRSFSFRLLHREDGQPLKYNRVCSRDGRVVHWEDTVKGYEVRKGEFIVFTNEELKAIAPESDRKIRIGKFVYYLSLDPMYFDTSYVLTPDSSEEAYNLFATTLRDLSMAAAGSITLRTKEYPVLVHFYRGGLVLTTLRYAEEVTPPQAFPNLIDLPVPKESEIALAKRIVNQLTGDFSIDEYQDHYHRAVMDLVKQKLAGEKIVYEEPHLEEAKELMQALKETLATLAVK